MPDEQTTTQTTSDLQWPPVNTRPTATNPYHTSGEYSYDPFNVSPEGNVYGTVRWIAEWPHPYWWDGQQNQTVIVSGEVDNIELMPTGPRPFGEIWRCREYVPATNSYVWRHYFWDSQDDSWKPLKWLWNVDALSKLPIPGFDIGDAHIVIERGVQVYWNGFQWVRPSHSSLNNDEPELHLPPGFVKWLPAEARVVYVNPREIALEAVDGGSGQVWVNGEYVTASKQCSVLTSLPVLEWDSQTNALVATYIDPSTEYWVYLANTQDVSYLQAALPGDDTHAATPAWDFRGKLFLSRSADVNGYLSDVGAGENARLVAKVQTDATPVSEGGPYFLRELNISIISRTTSFPETYRDYSDYRLEFVDYNRITLSLLDGAYGQIYVGGTLEYLGGNYDITLASRVLTWDDELPEKVALATDGAAANKLYFCYLAANVDPYNFNAVNPATNRPWMPGDDGAATHYDAELDLRLRPFLSEKTPDHGRLSEQWPGYYSRHIGQVRTDENARFINAADLSAIRQPTLNPTYFDGLAEIGFTPMNETEFLVTRIRGTSGITMVGGEAVQAYEQSSPNVHHVRTSDLVQEYTESNLTGPLSALDAISEHAGEHLYLYLANSRTFWGDLANQPFVSDQAPSNGYLSRNWPGNQARWLATLLLDGSGAFTGSYIAETIASVVVTIDDQDSSLSEVWSSAKVAAELTRLWAEVSIQQAFNSQQNNGVYARLSYASPTTIELAALEGEITVVFPDLTTRVVSTVSQAVEGDPYTLCYAYLPQAGDIYVSETAPDGGVPRLQTLGNDILVGYLGFTAGGVIGGEWGVYSAWNQAASDYVVAETSGYIYYSGVSGYNYLPRDGLVVPPETACSLTSNGACRVTFYWNGGGGWISGSIELQSTPSSHTDQWEEPVTVTAQRSISHSGAIAAGVYSATAFWERNYAALLWDGVLWVPGPQYVYWVWNSITGSLQLHLAGS